MPEVEPLEELKRFIPGSVMIGLGALLSYLMPEKLKLVGIVPIGIGTYLIYKELTTPPYEMPKAEIEEIKIERV